jgi:stearoyl-CoA desaturase (delta-9 desaturase)
MTQTLSRSDPQGTGAATGGRPVASRPAALTAVLRDPRGVRAERWLIAFFVFAPTLALVAAVPLAWGWGLGWHDIVIGAAFYLISGHGITVGFHRYFTHGAFKAKQGLRVALAVAGSFAIQGPVIRWVADHRRHHAYSDRDGDPHSPWRYGTSVGALIKGLWHAHIGWFFDSEQTNQQRFVPDLLADRAIVRVSKAFPWLAAISFLAPAGIGYLWSGMHWQGAATAFFWASLVRISLLHHVTWSINSICHTIGEKPFAARDRSGNVWWLALPSMGESWHNLHHADPTAARHGVLRGQLDSSARLIWVFERLNLVHDVRWPTPERISGRLVATT